MHFAKTTVQFWRPGITKKVTIKWVNCFAHSTFTFQRFHYVGQTVFSEKNKFLCTIKTTFPLIVITLQICKLLTLCTNLFLTLLDSFKPIQIMMKQYLLLQLADFFNIWLFKSKNFKLTSTKLYKDLHNHIFLILNSLLFR